MLVKGAPDGYWGDQRMGTFSNEVTTTLLKNRYLCYVLVPISKSVAVTSTRITRHLYTGPNNDKQRDQSIPPNKVIWNSYHEVCIMSIHTYVHTFLFSFNFVHIEQKWDEKYSVPNVEIELTTLKLGQHLQLPVLQQNKYMCQRAI